MLWKTRIYREIAIMKNDPLAGVTCYFNENHVNNFDVDITGPEGTPYEGGVFTLNVNLCDDYPFEPPTIKFLTKIYHPNVDDEGKIDLDILQSPPVGDWLPVRTLRGVLFAIRLLLINPYVEDPLTTDISKEFVHMIDTFNKKAKEYTLKYAS